MGRSGQTSEEHAPAGRSSGKSFSDLGHPVRLTIVAVIALTAIVIVGAVLFINAARNSELVNNKRSLSKTVLIASEQVSHILAAVTAVQTDIVQGQTAATAPNEAAFERKISSHALYQRLHDKVSGMPYVAALIIFSAHGRLLNFSRKWPIPVVDASDRAFIKAFWRNPNLTFFISRPVRSRVSGKWIVQLARRIVSRDGTFLGITSAAINLHSLQTAFDQIIHESGTGIKLIRTDGAFLIQASGTGSNLDNRRSSAASVRRPSFAGQDNVATSAAANRVDGLVATQRVGAYPLTVIGTRTSNNVFAKWRRLTGWTICVTAFALISILAFAILFIKMLRKQDALVKARAAQDNANRAQEQKLQLDAALENMTQGICLFDYNQRLIVCNRQYVELYGLTPEISMPGTTLRDILEYRAARQLLPVDNVSIDDLIGEAANNAAVKKVNLFNDGRSISVAKRPLSDGGWVATHEDITEQRRAEEELDETKKFLHSIIANIPIAVVVKDASTLEFVLTNQAFENALGLSGIELVGKSAFDIFGAEDAGHMEDADVECLQSSGGVLVREFNVNNPRLGRRILSAKRIVIRDPSGAAKYLLVVIEDVTEQRNAARQIEFLALHDSLTGLANRTTITQELRDLTQGACGHERSFTLFLLDLDRFKQVNDTLGHSAGDALLREMSARLNGALQNGDVLARLGGDEFAIIQVDIGMQHRDARALANHLIGVVGKPFKIDSNEIEIGVSIGAAMAPEHATDPDDLMRMADLALYQSKSEGRNCYRLFSPELGATANARRELENDLRHAIHNGEFELHYQPIVDAKSSKISMVEALIRWRHPEKGLINPDQFIPLAEEIGLISQIGEWVIHTACSDAASWPKAVKVAINISPVQLRMASLPDTVMRTVAQSGLAPDRLELEVTETALIEAPEECLPALQKLKERGIAIALDDFGTGYSSLSQITMFPFDKIKIDKSFTQNMTQRADCAAIITATLALARALDIETTAEGVETVDQCRLLRLAGVQFLQGYLFGRPGSREKLDFDAVYYSSELGEVA